MDDCSISWVLVSPRLTAHAEDCYAAMHCCPFSTAVKPTLLPTWHQFNFQFIFHRSLTGKHLKILKLNFLCTQISVITMLFWLTGLLAILLKNKSNKSCIKAELSFNSTYHLLLKHDHWPILMLMESSLIPVSFSGRSNHQQSFRVASHQEYHWGAASCSRW